MTNDWPEGFCCEDCQAFEPQGKGVGECRRRAPVVGRDPLDFAPWPRVERSDWCLDFVPPVPKTDESKADA